MWSVAFFFSVLHFFFSCSRKKMHIYKYIYTYIHIYIHIDRQIRTHIFTHPSIHDHGICPPLPHAPFFPLLGPFPHLPPSPLLCCISACLGHCYCSCLHSAAERAPYTRISLPLCSCDIIFPPCQPLASRGLISGDTATGETTRPNMRPGNRQSQLFSSVT